MPVRVLSELRMRPGDVWKMLQSRAAREHAYLDLEGVMHMRFRTEVGYTVFVSFDRWVKMDEAKRRNAMVTPTVLQYLGPTEFNGWPMPLG